MGHPNKISNPPLVYNFGDVKVFDNNGDHVLDKGDQVQLAKGKKEFFVDRGHPTSKAIQGLNQSLFGKKDVLVSGLHLDSAQKFLGYSSKAQKLDAAVSDPTHALDLGETLERGDAALSQARYWSGQLFDAKDPFSVRGAEASSLVAGISVALHLDIERRAEQEGDVVVARKFHNTDPKILETKAKGMLADLKRVSTESGPDTAKKTYEADLEELKSLGASRALLKSFKKGYHLLHQESKKAAQAPAAASKTGTGTGNLSDFTLEKENFAARLKTAASAGHKERAIAASASIKSLFGKEGMASSSAEAAKAGKAEYRSMRQDYQELSKAWQALQTDYKRLPETEQKRLLPEMKEMEFSFLYFQQDTASAELSARVAVRDHNAYFPEAKLDLPDPLPDTVRPYFTPS